MGVGKGYGKTGSVVGRGSPGPASPSDSQCRAAGLHTLISVAEGASPFSAGAAVAVGLARYHTLYPLKQNSGEHVESETGKDIPCKVINPARAMGTLELLVNMCFRPKACS